MRKVARIVRKFLTGLLLLVVGLLVIAQLALDSRRVRDLIREKAVPLASTALHANVEIDAIEAISLVGPSARVRGLRVKDDSGRVLASVVRAQVRCNALALLIGRLRISSIDLDRPYVNLGAPGAGGGGLLDLFATPAPSGAQPEKPKADTNKGGMRIELADVRIARGKVGVALGGAWFGVHALDFHGRADVAPVFTIGVEELSCQLRRNARPIGAIDSVRGDRLSRGDASLKLAAAIAGAKLDVDATLGRTSSGDPLAQTVRATIGVRGVSGSTLQQFGVDGSWLTAPVDLTLRAQGTLGQLEYTTDLDTPGGAVAVTGRVVKLQSLAATARIAGLHPRRFLRADVETVRGVVRVQADSDENAPGITRVVLAVDDARYGGLVLPRIDARGNFGSAAGMVLEQLDARYAFGSVSAQGKLGPDGSLALFAHAHAVQLARLPPVERALPTLSGAADADVHLSRIGGGEMQAQLAAVLQRPALGTNVRAASMRVRGELQGAELDAARVRLQVLTNDLDAGKMHVPMADLAVNGGPTRYVAIGRFGEHGRASVTLVHRGERFDADAEAHVVIDRHGGVLHAVIDDASYQNRVIALHAAHLAYETARADLSGYYEPDGPAELHASVQAADLRRVTAGFLPRPIPGALALQAQLKGNARKPKLDLQARYRKGIVYGMRVDGIDVSAHADVPERKITLAVAAQAEGGSLHAEAKTTLARAELSERAVRDGEHDVTLDLEHIPLEQNELWPKGRFIPERAQLSGKLHASGRLEQIALQTKLESHMIFPGERAPVTLAVEGSYDPKRLELAVNAADQQGPLLRTHMQTDLARDGIARELPALQKLIVERSWRAELWLGARRVDQLPAFEALNAPPALWPAQVSADVKLEHEPGTEPKGVVQLNAAWQPPGLQGGEPQCGLSRHPALQFRADMHDGELRTQTSLASEGRNMLAIHSTSHAPLDEWFTADVKRVQPANMSIEASDVNLADVPVMCDIVTGRLSGSIEVDRALMREVSVQADLKGHQLQFDKAPPFDAVIDAHADRRALLAHAKLSAASGSGDVNANVPLDGGGWMPTLALDGPARADLVFHRMEAGALLAPIRNVRASSGYIDGKLALTGTLRHPTLNGTLALDKVTATLGEAGQRFEQVTGQLALNGKELQLYKTTLRDREGKLEVAGKLNMSDFATWQAKLDAKADDYPIRRSGVMVARFTGKLGVDAGVEREGAKLDVELRGARVELTGQSLAGVQSLDPHPDVVFADGPPPEQKKPEASKKPIVLRVVSKDPFWVRREDFSALVMTDLRIEVRNGETNLSGPVEIQRGVVQLLGQLFDIQNGKITFAGGHQVEPTLELTATKRVPGGSLVTIEASGTLYQPTLTFQVDGATVTAGEALATATGTSAGTGSDTSVQQEMSSMAIGIATGVLTVGARRELGDWVPVLAVESGAGQTSVRAGVAADRFIPRFLRKVVVDAYVEGIFSAPTGADGSSQSGATTTTSDQTPPPANTVQTQAGVLLELRFPKQLVGEAQYGPGERWSLDLNWQP